VTNFRRLTCIVCWYDQITLTGLSLVVLSWLAFLYYCPYLECDANTPRWPWFLAAACLATYSVMDNMDGKQARRTGSSSPLGLLFDHGQRVEGPMGFLPCLDGCVLFPLCRL
jgi:phosphatidylglycerophosphate synthase